MTDDSGHFAVDGAPTGNVTISFERDGCSASFELNDVAADSTITLSNIQLTCDHAAPERTEETFTGVLENKPASRNGNLLLCADSAGGHSRAVDARSASIEDTSGDSITVADLREADQLDVTGTRRGLGADSTLDATTITRVASNAADPCRATATPSGTTTPSSTGTPGAATIETPAPGTPTPGTPTPGTPTPGTPTPGTATPTQTPM
jgi:hypothetical protein